MYIVPTPLGNLRDITLRALDVLRDVDIIFCEDTRHTRKLLSHYSISKQLVSCEKFSEARRSAYIIDQLEEGKHVALVSDAGTPAVSDPGSRVIGLARSRGIPVVALPGPSALITAFSASGFTHPFRFIGFFPRKKEAMEKEIQRMGLSDEVTIFYESPRRIERTLFMIHRRVPDREICLARELTKIHEQYLVGTVEKVLGAVRDSPVRGEVTVLVNSATHEESFQADTLREMAGKLLERGCSVRDALLMLSRETGINRNELYPMILDVKKTLK